MKLLFFLFALILLVGCAQQKQIANLGITSPAIGFEGHLAVKYTCDGDKINPQLYVTNIPYGAKSLVLFLEDPDAASGTFTHWVVWNIPPTKVIAENSVPGVEGLNSAGNYHYVPPCPPSGTHRYFFKVYALDTELNISAGSKKAVVENAIREHITAAGGLVGMYGRS
jgi:Raf kinase inhibitor-like YbhB/YbcL family protein